MKQKEYLKKNRSAIATAGKKFRTANISQRVRKIVISPIKEMSILADELEARQRRVRPGRKQVGPNKIISFGQGIPYLDTPVFIKKGIKKSLNEVDTAKYTLEPGINELRFLLAKYLAQEKKIKNIKPKKEIMVTVGAQEAMVCALATIIDEKDEVLLPSPAYPSHIEQIIQLGGVPKFVPLDEKNNWHLDVKELEKNLTKKTKAILLSNPSNPTGKVLDKQELSTLCNFVKKNNLILITDETYDFLTYEGVKHISPASLPMIKNQVIVCGSFSKKYRMTGYRIGYAFADEGIIDHMLKVHDALAICAPTISQKAVITGLRNQKESKKSIKYLVQQMAKNRKLMCHELDKLQKYLNYQKPMGSYYIFAKLKKTKINSLALSVKILKEAKIITIPGSAFGPQGEGHLRFSFAGQPEEIKPGFARLKKWFEEYYGK